MAKRKSHPLQNLSLISYIGISMIVPIAGGLYIGRWMDQKFNTQPIFLFASIITGVVVAFINLFKVATKDIEKRKRK
ncbi:AtpZ/AtpI family protein [Alkaliphilus serpentinus]|uniref:AtpZ/AtpI family protein n=1 Tax=Alkaliphilus serpentinus TaxID=1482731 RepID=A0A833HQF3_9FIRM|nr:AtpZ/AtpI family protein [Alkaliphilus serpentinus]KAB3530891.1 AtpZ/AtpI family protein [Alkaliphilus serpentinus]